MLLYTFYVSGEKRHEVQADSRVEAMEKANALGLPYGFYAWMECSPNSFSAMFGAWD